MMIPLRRSFIVQEHETLLYPEGRACASVLIAGDKGGDCARNAFFGVGVAFLYAFLQKVLHAIAGVPAYVTSAANKYFPAATFNAEITPEYLGMGYIIGVRSSGIMFAGGLLSWLCFIPLLATLVPPDVVAAQLVKLGELPDVLSAGGPGGWDPASHSFAAYPAALYKAYVRQIGAGAVACAGFITLLKTLPVIVTSFKSSLNSLKQRGTVAISKRTDTDLPLSVVLVGIAAVTLAICFVPGIPGETIANRLAMALLVLFFGFFFVTVSTRIVGIIGSSSNPISGMTIASLMGTCLCFILLRWTGITYEPMALAVVSMICIIVACSGACMQAHKAGYLLGATPKNQQIAYIVGLISAACVGAATTIMLDKPTADLAAQGMNHMIGTNAFPAPQGTLMATLVRGLLAFNLDWQYVIVGAVVALAISLCGVSPLSFAVGIYLPLSTTLPIFVGGMVRSCTDAARGKKAEASDDLGSGSLFATGLIAGGALAGVAVAMCSVNDGVNAFINNISLAPALTGALGQGGYNILGVICFALLAAVLVRFALRQDSPN